MWNGRSCSARIVRNERAREESVGPHDWIEGQEEEAFARRCAGSDSLEQVTGLVVGKRYGR